MLYYVAMFQQKKFWRVIKTQNDVRAESVYTDFAEIDDAAFRFGNSPHQAGSEKKLMRTA